ncbi:MAG: class I SAM-dependent methyltransferase [Bacteroidota bacterium]
MIKKWHLKAVVQKIISYLPGSSRLNYFFQRYVTKGVLLDDTHFGYKIQHAADHLDHLKKYTPRSEQEELTILELGLGWYPIIPTVFYLTGRGRTISYDIYDWMTAQSMIKAFEKTLEWLDDGRLCDLFKEHPFIPERVDTLRGIVDDSLLSKPSGYDRIPQSDSPNQTRGSKPPGDVWTRESLNKIIGLTPKIQDARQSGLAPASIDFICSNNTFEHVHAEVLSGILAEFQRVLKPGGISSHFIDMSDHFAHFDSSITVYNFLQFSERQWRRIDNNIQPQNRLRMPDYQAMYQALEIPVLDTIVRPGNLDTLSSVSLANPFRELPAEQVAITHAYMVSSR